MGHGRAPARARDLRARLRRAARRRERGRADAARRRGGDLQGRCDGRAHPRRAGAQLARASACGHGGAAGPFPAEDRERRVDRRLRAHRARLRLGCRRDAHGGQARRRRVRPQRLEALHHERRGRAPLHGVREDRPVGGSRRHLMLHGRVRRTRFRGRPHRAEARDQRLDHRRGLLQRLPRAGSEPHRRARARASRSRCGSSTARGRDWRAGARHRPGRDRLCARLRAVEGDHGQADRRAPDDRGEARGHGDEVRGGARAPLQGRSS